MRWIIALRPRAEKDLVRLGAATARQVFEKLAWLEKHFDEITPQRLSGTLSSYFKFRVGDYRVLYDFDVNRMIIRIFRIEHRSKVYNK